MSVKNKKRSIFWICPHCSKKTFINSCSYPTNYGNMTEAYKIENCIPELTRTITCNSCLGIQIEGDEHSISIRS